MCSPCRVAFCLCPFLLSCSALPEIEPIQFSKEEDSNCYYVETNNAYICVQSITSHPVSDEVSIVAKDITPGTSPDEFEGIAGRLHILAKTRFEKSRDRPDYYYWERDLGQIDKRRISAELFEQTTRKTLLYVDSFVVDTGPVIEEICEAEPDLGGSSFFVVGPIRGWRCVFTEVRQHYFGKNSDRTKKIDLSFEESACDEFLRKRLESDPDADYESLAEYREQTRPGIVGYTVRKRSCGG